MKQYPALARVKDIIEDSLDVVESDIHDSIESVEPSFTQEHVSAEEDDDYSLTRRSSKRRRLSSSPILGSQNEDLTGQYGKINDSHNECEDILSSNNTAISSPLAGPRHRPPSSTMAPRFILPSTPVPAPPSTPVTAQTTFVKPPRFRPPDDQEPHQRPIEPLPDAFSPQRRGQKFLAGGLAAEVIGWVMNLESNAPASSSTRSREDTWVIQLIVNEVRGGHGPGMTLISGRQAHEGLDGRDGPMAHTLGVVKVILAGSGTAEVLQKANKVDVGKKIRIRGPVWEVFIKGEKWGVAVTWEVVS